jgi:metallo-beta-lactamase family protein
MENVKTVLPGISSLVQSAKLDGWLFYDFRGCNPIARQILGISETLSRRWFLFVPATGTPKLLVSRVEVGSWEHILAAESLERWVYNSHEELDGFLAEALKGAKTIAMEYSPRGAVPYVAKVDAGTIERVLETGVKIVSSADLIQTFLTWDATDRLEHDKAVAGVMAAKDAAFALIHERLMSKAPVTELEVQALVSQKLTEAGLIFDHGAIVGFAGHAGDPHFAPNETHNTTLEFGMCVLIDLWAGVPGRPLCDVTWMGFAGEPTAEFLQVWDAVSGARDAALKLLRSKPGLQGWEVDKAARDVIEAAGYGAKFVHRLGHSLGRGASAHGDGANLDNLETHDERLLIPDTAVTVEPGIYLENLGVRSEVNVLLTAKGAVVTTPIQRGPYVLGLEGGVYEHGNGSSRISVSAAVGSPVATSKTTVPNIAIPNIAIPNIAVPNIAVQTGPATASSSKKSDGGTTMKITSYGAARTVTGSNHLLEMGGQRLMLDCGVFQGSRLLEELNHQEFAFDPTSITAMVLSHAHNDHAGRVPKLVKDGYSGPIYATPATKALCEFMLLDGAKLQREDFERNQRKGREATPPIYTEEDVAKAILQFREVEYDAPFKLGELEVRLQKAGHVPGSASVVCSSGGETFVFSGDIGNQRKDVLPDPVPCPDANVVVMESTYGDRDHRDFDQTLLEFTALLKNASETGGKILIPSFALERTQDVLFHIARLEEAGAIPVLPVFVDSPLASKVETVYSEFQDEFSENVQAFYRKGQDPFRPKNLKYTQTIEDSKKLNDMNEAAIIIAGSGMMAGGRILHHMINHLSDPNTTLMIVGFQPEGGLGRLLVDGEKSIKIMGQQIQVRAKVVTVGGFSAHADKTELLEWSKGVTGQIRLVHGEVSSMEGLQKSLEARGQQAIIQEPTGYDPQGGRKDEGAE